MAHLVDDLVAHERLEVDGHGHGNSRCFGRFSMQRRRAGGDDGRLAAALRASQAAHKDMTALLSSNAAALFDADVLQLQGRCVFARLPNRRQLRRARQGYELILLENLDYAAS